MENYTKVRNIGKGGMGQCILVRHSQPPPSALRHAPFLLQERWLFELPETNLDSIALFLKVVPVWDGFLLHLMFVTAYTFAIFQFLLLTEKYTQHKQKQLPFLLLFLLNVRRSWTITARLLFQKVVYHSVLFSSFSSFSSPDFSQQAASSFQGCSLALGYTWVV